MFGLRFDIDSHYGLTRRVAPLLKVLDRHDTKATFFCVMGRDASLIEIAKLRFMGKGHRRSSARPQDATDSLSSDVEPTRKPGRSTFLRNPGKILYTMIYPRRVGTGRPDLLRLLQDTGHEVYPHGWSHIQWQRNIDRIDVREHIRLCSEAHREVFGILPAGFASPGMVYNDEVLDAFDENGIMFAGDMRGESPFRVNGRRCLQIPVTTRKTISWLNWKGYEQSDIVDMLYQHISGNGFSVIFDHPDNMGHRELRALDVLLGRLSADGIRSIPFGQIHARTMA